MLGMAALAAGVYAALSLRSSASAGRIMLAVLPSQNLTGDPEQEYLADGLTEEVIAILAASTRRDWESSGARPRCIQETTKRPTNRPDSASGICRAEPSTSAIVPVTHS